MTWIQTWSGRAFDFTNPDPDSVDIADIASHLSKLCRFAGAVHTFYSVAEHSVYVSRMVPREYALQGLLHDATEAYVVDLPKPLKDMLPDYRVAEQRVWEAVARHFGLPLELDESVKDADIRMLLAERDQLLVKPPIPWTWANGIQPAKFTIRCHVPSTAKLAFLDRFYELTRT